jgi:hypothetical protein
MLDTVYSAAHNEHSRLTPPVGDAPARDVATTRGRRHHTEIANLYTASVYLLM